MSSDLAANITGGNLLTAGLISATSTITSAANVIGGNITTAGLVTATGNVTGGNILTAGLISATSTITSAANITGGNLLTVGLISATSTITSAANVVGGNITTAGLVTATGNVTGGNILTAGLMSSTGNAIHGNILTAGLISATGNITGNFILGNGSQLTGIITSVSNVTNGNSNVNISAAAANITVSVSGVGNVVVFSPTGEYVAGLLSVSGNVTGGNLLTAGLISATSTITSAANIIGGNITTAGLVTATGNVTGGNITTAGLVTATGNVTGGNILTAGLISATSTITSAANIIGGNITTAGLVTATGNVTGGNIVSAGIISTSGNIFGGGIRSTSSGTAPTSPSVGDFWYNTTTNVQYRYTFDGTSYYWIDDFGASAGVNGTFSLITNGTTSANIGASNGNITITVGGTAIAAWTTAGLTNLQANGVGNIGNASTYFNTIFAKASSAQYADLAETYVADDSYAPGTLVIFGGADEITASTVSHDTRVAGIISTDPAYLMNSGAVGLPVALTGRVPCSVVGTIRKGDRLVASTIKGVATVLDATKYLPGCIIGKALADYDSNSTGVIEVAVGRY